MSGKREELEADLNNFSGKSRHRALEGLVERANSGGIVFPAARDIVNLHCHTFFSYNGYGYSPSCFAWKARCAGLKVAGVVDFDVLDAADEFLDACALLGLRGCAGIETRVFVPECATREINSPGEPGIAYFMGVGFTGGSWRGLSVRAPGDETRGLADRATGGGLLTELKSIAQGRNREIAARVNAFLAPASVDYEKDVLPLTPNGNATERHLCAAYDNKARTIFPKPDLRAAFWAEKLGTDAAKVEKLLDDAPGLQGLIRAKTMKAGGVGYVKPSGPDFPLLEDVSRFVLKCGAIPTFTWLDGTSEGEQAIDELLDVSVAAGAAAVNIIPDRNWNIKDPDVKQLKVRKLYEFVQLAHRRDLPIVVGTEMNAYGQRFVDDFDAPELKPLTAMFLRGACIVYAHTVLQTYGKMGYLSGWAKGSFSSVAEKNEFFAAVGEKLEPTGMRALEKVTPACCPADILKLL